MPTKQKLTVARAVKLVALLQVLVKLFDAVEWTPAAGQKIEVALGKTERIAAAVAAVEAVLAELESGD